MGSITLKYSYFNLNFSIELYTSVLIFDKRYGVQYVYVCELFVLSENHRYKRLLVRFLLFSCNRETGS